MKRLLAALLFLFLLFSCFEGKSYNLFLNIDRTPPVVESYALKTNRLFRIVYDEEVIIDEIVFDGNIIKTNLKGQIIEITLPRDLKSGEKVTLSVTAEDYYGNSSRFSLSVTGINENLPKAVINEVSIQGTSASPDRIEILFLSDGNTAGMEIADGTYDNHNNSYTLEEKDVKENDMFLIYWNITTEERVYDNDAGGVTWVFYAASSKTLSGTNGALILYETEGGDVMDGLVYTAGTSSNNNGFGNTITEDSYILLTSCGEWDGDAVSSALVTSSRVLARLPEGYDTNTNEDFFTTAAKGSTFGGANIYNPYTE